VPKRGFQLNLSKDEAIIRIEKVVKLFGCWTTLNCSACFYDSVFCFRCDFCLGPCVVSLTFSYLGFAIAMADCSASGSATVVVLCT
jgi:hypothetical protein